MSCFYYTIALGFVPIPKPEITILTVRGTRIVQLSYNRLEKLSSDGPFQNNQKDCPGN
jgi:hypothetical protein